MNGNYVNWAEIDKVQKIVDDIFPGLRIVSYNLNHDETIVTAVWISLPLKGNAETIKKFEAAGFRRVRKYKPSSINEWCNRGGFSFWLDMKFSLPEPPKEG